MSSLKFLAASVCVVLLFVNFAHGYGEKPCSRGPAYWCASEKQRQECNVSLTACINNFKYNENGERLLESLGSQRVGENPCTQGPSFWCNNEENKKRCEIPVGYCEELAEKAKAQQS